MRVSEKILKAVYRPSIPVDGTIAGNMNTAFLKILALAFMMADHLGSAIFKNVQ